MRKEVAADWAWAKGHEMEAIEYLREHILNVEDSTREDDLKHCTDYVIHPVPKLHCAIRIRRLSKTPSKDLTLRFDRSSRAKTEYQKILEGYADLYVYKWINDLKGDEIDEYMIVDINAMRAANQVLRYADDFRKAWDQESKTWSRFGCWTWQTLQDHGCLVEMVKYPNGPISYRLDPNWHRGQIPPDRRLAIDLYSME